MHILHPIVLFRSVLAPEMRQIHIMNLGISAGNIVGFVWYVQFSSFLESKCTLTFHHNC